MRDGRAPDGPFRLKGCGAGGVRWRIEVRDRLAPLRGYRGRGRDREVNGGRWLRLGRGTAAGCRGLWGAVGSRGIGVQILGQQGGSDEGREGNTAGTEGLSPRGPCHGWDRRHGQQRRDAAGGAAAEALRKRSTERGEGAGEAQGHGSGPGLAGGEVRKDGKSRARNLRGGGGGAR